MPDRVVMEKLARHDRYQHVMSTMLEDAGRRLEAFFPVAQAAGE